MSSSPHTSNRLSIVCQALPEPSEDDSPVRQLFNHLIQRAYSVHPHDASFVTILHAVSKHFDLHKMPTSPPATPNLTMQRDDYFGQSIFKTAAVVPAYHDGSSTPRSPNVAAPPGSVDVSLLERVIPPSTETEVYEFFDIHGHSSLVDRLAELSTNGGSLVCVYPTMQGGETFMRTHLNPILTPLLTRMTVVNDMNWRCAEQLNEISGLTALPSLLDMNEKMKSLCDEMTRRASRNYQPSRFELVHQDRAEVALDYKTWSKWFLAQQHQIMKRTVIDYFRRGESLPKNEEINAITLVNDIVQTLIDKDGRYAMHTGQPIEVGVFVIRRQSL